MIIGALIGVVFVTLINSYKEHVVNNVISFKHFVIDWVFFGSAGALFGFVLT